jgi:hypothetical protein
MSYLVENKSKSTIYFRYKATYPTGDILPGEAKTVPYEILDDYQMEVFEKTPEGDSSWGQVNLNDNSKLVVYGRFTWCLNTKE